MKNYLLIASLVSLTSFSCGVRSLYSLASNENEGVFKKELIGNWQDEDSSRYIIDTVAKNDGKVYSITIIDKKSDKGFSDTSFFSAILVNLKSKFFLDCSADPDKLGSIGESAAMSLLPSHFVIKIYSIKQNEIEAGTIELSEIVKLMQQNKIKMRFEKLSKDDYLLTEKPKYYQDKILELDKFPMVYKKQSFTRVP